MEDFLTNYGCLALFVLSFFASTLLPLGSEWLLVTLLLKGHSPTLVVATATAGNTLGAFTTYAIGWFGGAWLIERVLRIDSEKRKKAEETYQRYGSWSLLLSWLPIVGDPLCAVGGLLKVGMSRFFLLVLAGKLARYLVIAWLTLVNLP
jgi:membrane protein YqaA with SNARE-associated domain